jgi:hypothetical protein
LRCGVNKVEEMKSLSLIQYDDYVEMDPQSGVEADEDNQWGPLKKKGKANKNKRASKKKAASKKEAVSEEAISTEEAMSNDEPVINLFWASVDAN